MLALPFASASGSSCGLLTALFTSTSATCVTGLTVVSTETYWSLFGQLVILVLCQIGGLGIMSTIYMFYLALDKRIGLRRRMVLMESLNLNEFEGVVVLVKHVLIGTLAFEFIGAIILTGCLIPEFGLAGGLWRGIFMSVSAFCNAGFTVVYSDTFFSNAMPFSSNPIILITMIALILLGSIGFYVWEDVYKKGSLRRLHIHSKLAIITTAILTLSGMIAYIALETGEGGSLSSLSSGKQLLVSLFQSVSDRTVGIDAAGHLLNTDQTKFVTMILMFIGGSSGSTAGGVKTVTVAILFLSVISTIRGRQELIVFEKKISQTQVIQAATLVITGIVIISAGSIAVSLLNNAGLTESIFETVSVYSTAGLSLGLTQAAGPATIIMFIIFMFFGKIGIMSISIAFMMHRGQNLGYTYPAERVIIG